MAAAVGNQYAVGNKGGQPRLYKSPEQMQIAIDTYFEDEENMPFTVCGLSIALGFMDRKSLIDYGGYSKEYFHTIKKAKFRIEHYLEQTLFKGKPTGAIFNLKNNFGWQDKSETVHSGEVTLAQAVARVIKKEKAGDQGDQGDENAE